MFFKLQQSNDSFEKCFKPHLSYLYRIAMRLCNNNEDAEDIVHDLILKVHASKTDLSSLDNPKTWLAKILYRLFVDSYRKKQRFSVVSITASDDEADGIIPFEPLDEANDPEYLAEQQYITQNIEKALLTLSSEHRMMIIMFEIEGFSIPEISEILVIPTGTVKSRLHRARIKIRTFLENKGTEWEAQACSTVNTGHSQYWRNK